MNFKAFHWLTDLYACKNAETNPTWEKSQIAPSRVSLGILELLLELVELVLHLPHVLVRERLFLLAVLQLLLEVLDGFLRVLRAQCHVLLHVDLVPSAIVHLVRGRVSVILALVLVDGLALDAKVTTLHDPLFGGHVVAEFLVV